MKNKVNIFIDLADTPVCSWHLPSGACAIRYMENAWKHDGNLYRQLATSGAMRTCAYM